MLKQENKTYGFLASFPAGVKKTGQQLDFYIQQFKLILNPKTGAYKGLGGFKTMASIFPSSGWNWEAFLEHYCVLLNNTGIHESFADSGFRWRPCLVYFN